MQEENKKICSRSFYLFPNEKLSNIIRNGNAFTENDVRKTAEGSFKSLTQSKTAHNINVPQETYKALLSVVRHDKENSTFGGEGYFLGTFRTNL